jgi:hypothetical protein
MNANVSFPFEKGFLGNFSPEQIVGSDGEVFAIANSGQSTGAPLQPVAPPAGWFRTSRQPVEPVLYADLLR